MHPLLRKSTESVAQQVEHIPFKDGVLGSSPSWFTSESLLALFFLTFDSPCPLREGGGGWVLFFWGLCVLFHLGYLDFLGAVAVGLMLGSWANALSFECVCKDTAKVGFAQDLHYTWAEIATVLPLFSAKTKHKVA